MTKTARGLTHIRVGYAGAHSNQKVKRADTSCATGGFYKNPTNGQSLTATDPLNISWDTTCLDSGTKAVDIYLYAPGQTQSLIHEWENVPYAAGSYQTNLQPKWWNSSSTVNLQFKIVVAGQPTFMNTLPAGPVFTAKFTSAAGGSTASDSSAVDSGITDVSQQNVKHGLSGGKIAAAVIIPLLVIGLCIAAFFKFSRAKGEEKRKRWSEAVDKRMSTISTDWKSMSPAGANAAIRSSMAMPGNRASSFSFGALRPTSEFTTDGGNAGIGARGLYTHDNGGLDEDAQPQMSQLRSGPRPPAAFTGDRVSRVSFAADPRPSTDRRTVTSRAFHNGFVPPVPSRSDSDDLMSPTQTQGPLPLDQDDINARVSGPEDVDDYMPALKMMRTGSHGPTETDADDDYILPPPSMPTPPTPTHQIPQSPPASMMPGQPMPASVMSPDEMLRAYATRRVTSPPSTPAPGNLAYPAPVVNYNGNGMRTLYSPTTPGSAVPLTRDMHQAYAYNDDDNEDAYGGTAH